MAATDQQILDEAKDSLLRILQTDTSSWSEAHRMQQQLRIGELERLIDNYERKTAAVNTPIVRPVRRVRV